MALRSPGEADRFIAEAEQQGLNDAHLRRMRADVEEARGRSHALAQGAAQDAFERTHRIGEAAMTEFDAITEHAEAVASATDNGELTPEEGRDAIAKLLARYNNAATRAQTFATSADSCIAIESDPEAWSENFYREHPDVRPEFDW